MDDDRIPPVTFDDALIGYLSESVYEIHRETVRSAGFDTTQLVSDEQRALTLGVVASILSSVFTPVFGQTPDMRYKDVFEQISVFSEHLAKRHAFPDGNKRTTMQISLALLGLCGVRLNVADPLSPEDNAMYQWIQNVVTGDRTTQQLAQFLRDHVRTD